MAENLVICIAREFGSGGREVGVALAKRMEIAFYDRELLKNAADKSGILQELFEKADEKPASGLLNPISSTFGMPEKSASYADYTSYLPNDRMQNVLAEVIRDAADKSPCVIIGRCADYVLRGRKRMLSVFLHAAPEMRIQRIARLHNLDEDGARALLRKTDRSRANYYNYYTDRDWGLAENYDLSIDCGRLGTEKSVELIQRAAELFCP